ncbi:hypothetical protein IV38_GL000004 [Lactobacillus selangorensis]|uniref:Uncharacterized protein n=1 Tax=Lactobacillus selangorensis TaxID=81857 RepID=A0A0R2FUG5_9LACO|nr:hypothetical protein IV38_GL000004 [Lactobacillus selangorensis]KRN31516.1 hypothetical protein IV40_GL001514 [Lactobacillus selangorensis]
MIKTRFTPKQGYIVQSKRGGGGYIRIQKAQFMDDHELLDQMVENVPATISQRDALAVVQRLYDEEIIDRKTSNIILATLSHQTLNVGSKKIEDGLRARLLVAILESLRYESK